MKQSILESVQANADDIAAGEDAFTLLQPQRDALPIEAVQSANLDVRAAANAVLGVARYLAKQDVHLRFAALPREEFDPAHVRLLAPAAWAALYAYTRSLSATASSTEARVPDALLTDATDTRSRMIKVLEYHVDETIELDSIREGTGHADLATDLTRLAALYSKHREVIAVDQRLYRASDERLAGRLAAQILRSLTVTPGSEAKAWQDAENRAWTILRGHYDEVRAAGLWLFRREGGEQKFPSLAAATRPRRRSTQEHGSNPTPSSDSPSVTPAPDAAPPVQPAH